MGEVRSGSLAMTNPRAGQRRVGEVGLGEVRAIQVYAREVNATERSRGQIGAEVHPESMHSRGLSCTGQSRGRYRSCRESCLLVASSIDRLVTAVTLPSRRLRVLI